MEKNDKAEIVRFIKLIKGMNERQQNGLLVMLTGITLMNGKEKSGIKTANHLRS